MVVHRFEVYLVALDPARGHEIQKTRPCVIISPDEINRHLHTVVIAPLTTAVRKYVSRVSCRFEGRQGEIALDQIRCVDRARLLKRLGTIDATTAGHVRSTLVKMFK